MSIPLLSSHEFMLLSFDEFVFIFNCYLHQRVLINSGVANDSAAQGEVSKLMKNWNLILKIKALRGQFGGFWLTLTIFSLLTTRSFFPFQIHLFELFVCPNHFHRFATFKLCSHRPSSYNRRSVMLFHLLCSAPFFSSLYVISIIFFISSFHFLLICQSIHFSILLCYLSLYFFHSCRHSCRVKIRILGMDTCTFFLGMYTCAYRLKYVGLNDVWVS